MGINYYVEAFKRTTDFQGVSTRPEYWYFYLWNVIIAVTVMLIFGEESIPDLIYTLVTVIPSLSVGIRRLHDIGKSGWNLLWVFTIIGVFYILYLFCQPSSGSHVEENDEEDHDTLNTDEIEEEYEEDSSNNDDNNDSDLSDELKGFK